MSAVQIADLISIYIYTSDGVRKYRRTRRAKKRGGQNETIDLLVVWGFGWNKSEGREVRAQLDGG